MCIIIKNKTKSVNLEEPYLTCEITISERMQYKTTLLSVCVAGVEKSAFPLVSHLKIYQINLTPPKKKKKKYI